MRLTLIVSTFAILLAGCTTTASNPPARDIQSAPEITPTTTPDLDRVSVPRRGPRT